MLNIIVCFDTFHTPQYDSVDLLIFFMITILRSRLFFIHLFDFHYSNNSNSETIDFLEMLRSCNIPIPSMTGTASTMPGGASHPDHSEVEVLPQRVPEERKKAPEEKKRASRKRKM